MDRETDYARKRNELLRGHGIVEKNITSNIVRVFVSSTFADMSMERNILYNKAYPELRNFCQSLGLEFQVIDMRWGVRDTAFVDHSITSLCLLEVKNCIRLSMGPYFAVFVGNRYGYQPLPNAIRCDEFAVLKKVAEDTGLDRDCLLDKWYKDDENNMASVKILEPITKYFPHFNHTDPEFLHESKKQQAEWMKTFQQLTHLIHHCSKIALNSQVSSDGMKFDYIKSVTEMEVEAALQPKDRKKLFVYCRNIPDVVRHTEEEIAKSFVDITEHRELDMSKQILLSSMKKKVVQHVKKTKNVRHYNIPWKDISCMLSDNQKTVLLDQYIQRISDDFVLDMKNSVLQAIADESRSKGIPTDANDTLFEEVLHHAVFAQRKSINFCGRDKLIENIRARIHEGNNIQPILIVGGSGSGKTSLIAKLIEEEQTSKHQTVIIYRFLGTSPSSSNVHKLLKSLIYQISQVFEKDDPPSHVLENFSDAVEVFSDLLQAVSKYQINDKKSQLLIFLDSLDQLSTIDSAHRLTWLPKILPKRVTVVVSSLPEPDFEIAPILRRYIPTELNEFKVNPLDNHTAQEILDKSLKIIDRCLTTVQKDKILQAFSNTPFPLFLKLMIEESKKWTSSYDVTNVVLPNSTKNAIAQFYDNLEKAHGKTFVTHTIGYIVASRDGVTENELQDLLSLDDEVLQDVYEHWPPPSDDIVRIPSFTWTRLSYDLGEYLVRRQATGHTVLALFHRYK